MFLQPVSVETRMISVVLPNPLVVREYILALKLALSILVIRFRAK